MKGNKQRTQEPTAANQTSSRSHAVLQVAVRQQSRCRDVLQEVRFARLFMIDLAGSERAAQVCGAGGPDRLPGLRFPAFPAEGMHGSVWRFYFCRILWSLLSFSKIMSVSPSPTIRYHFTCV